MRKISELWVATTMGEKFLILVSVGLYVRCSFDVANRDIISFFVHLVANGIVTLILIWSMRRPRGSGF